MQWRNSFIHLFTIPFKQFALSIYSVKGAVLGASEEKRTALSQGLVKSSGFTRPSTQGEGGGKYGPEIK